MFRFTRLVFRFAEARKLPNIWDIPPHSYVEMSNAIFAAWNTKQLGHLLKENVPTLTDQQVAFALERMAWLNLDADAEFYESMVPVIKDFVLNFNREHASSLAIIMAACARVKAQDPSLWELFEKKLIEQRLFRYVPIAELVDLTVALSDTEFGTHQLYKTLESQISRHTLALSNTDLKQTALAFEKKKIASPKLASLEQHSQ